MPHILHLMYGAALGSVVFKRQRRPMEHHQWRELAHQLSLFARASFFQDGGELRTNRGNADVQVARGIAGGLTVENQHREAYLGGRQAIDLLQQLADGTLRWGLFELSVH